MARFSGGILAGLSFDLHGLSGGMLLSMTGSMITPHGSTVMRAEIGALLTSGQTEKNAEIC